MAVLRYDFKILDRSLFHAYCNTMRAKPEVKRIPEFEKALEQYGVSWEDEPHYAIVGAIKTPLAGRRVGVLAFASNEFHAHLLRKKFETCGLARAERTVYHPDAKTKEFFDVEGYFEKLLTLR